METAAALPHLAPGGQQGIGKRPNLLLGLSEHVERKPLGRAGTNPRQPLKLIDQTSEWSGEAAQRPGAVLMNLGGLSPVSGRRENGGQANGCPMMVFSLFFPLSLRSLARAALSFVFLLTLAGGLGACSAAAAGLQSFQSPDGRYAFLYPTGWNRVQVSGGPQVVFHDLINSDETLSLVISEVNSTNDLANLGTAEAVGEKLRQVVIAPDGSGRQAELVEARERELAGRTFYDLEYSVHLADRNRHELATVVVDRGRLYTFAASTNEARWPKVRELFERVISSFNLLV
jgi:photosystem II oxygen-evolving enhancer protein 2